MALSLLLTVICSGLYSKTVNIEAGGNPGLGTAMPYGTVIVPESHEAAVAAGTSLALQGFGLWYVKPDLAGQVIFGFNRTASGVDYSGSVHNKEYRYTVSFLEFGGGISGLLDLTDENSLYYEGGLLYLSPVSDLSLSVNGEEQTPDESMSTGSDISLYGGGGLQYLLPDTDNRVHLRAGIRLRAGMLPVIKGRPGVALTEKEDSLRQVSAMFMLGAGYKL